MAHGKCYRSQQVVPDLRRPLLARGPKVGALQACTRPGASVQLRAAVFQLFQLDLVTGTIGLMTAAVTPLVRDLEARARRDARFVRVLDALRDAPTGPQGTLERSAARALNDQRRTALVEEFIDGALSTADVQERLGYATPQAVHRLRTRKRLIGAAVGNKTWFPAWQFDGRRLRADLPRILELLARFTDDAVAADRIMRLQRDDLDGASIAEALDHAATAASAWRALTALGA